MIDEWEQWKCLICTNPSDKLKVPKATERKTLLICSICHAAHVHVKRKNRVKYKLALRDTSMTLDEQFATLNQ